MNIKIKKNAEKIMVGYCNTKKVRDCYIFHKFLLVIILLLLINITFLYYTKKTQKTYCHASNIKWKRMNFKKFVLKIVRVIICVT